MVHRYIFAIVSVSSLNTYIYARIIDRNESIRAIIEDVLRTFLNFLKRLKELYREEAYRS